MAFDASTLEIFGPLAAGGTIEIFTGRHLTTEVLRAFLIERRITGLWLTSGLFRLMADHCPEAFTRVRQVITGGDVVPPAQASRVLRACPGIRVTNGYGPTENTTFTTVHHIDDPAELDETIPIGRPIRGGGVLVVDAAGRPVPTGAAGELLAYGDGLAVDYLNDPAETARRFIWMPDGRRCYRTGDLVRWDSNGRLRFLGRIDHQVKIRGFRVELDAVAAVLRAAPGVADVVVYTATGTTASAERRLIAGIITRQGHEPSDGLRDYAVQRLPEYAVPSLWSFVTEFPLTSNGKVDVARLVAIAMDTVDPSPVAPACRRERPDSISIDIYDVEDRIARIWEEVLGSGDFGYDDRFFDVGGDSLQLPQLRNHLQIEFPATEVTVFDLLRFPTISALAARLGSRIGAQA